MRFESRLHTQSLWSRLINPGLKDGDPRCFKIFFPHVLKTIPDGWAVAVVPGHRHDVLSSGIRKLVSSAAKKKGILDLTGVLQRERTIQKLQQGGDRRPEVHFGSIVVRHKKEIEGKKIVLFDDVTVTGNSLVVCKKLLIGTGAKNVSMVALTKAKYFKILLP